MFLMVNELDGTDRVSQRVKGRGVLYRAGDVVALKLLDAINGPPFNLFDKIN